MDIVLGYALALVIGLVIGILGGGGSILTVPVLVYLLKISPVIATAYSLFVVGTSSLFGTFQNIRKGIINFKVGFIFAFPSLIAVYATRKYLLPNIPDTIDTGILSFSKDTAIMVFFAFIMFLASLSMIIKRKEVKVKDTKLNYLVIGVEGLIVGVVTGIVGAGGGFIIIPALVILAHQNIKTAVATSLLIITIKSLLGFLGELGNFVIDWHFLLLFTSFAIIGTLMGGYVSKYIKNENLKTIFGWFILIMSLYIILAETFL